MLRAALVEDSQEDARKILLYLKQFGEKQQITFQTDHFNSAELFLDRYRPVYDIVFMDIELPGSNGMEAARKLRRIDPAVTLIFITNLSAFAVNGYEVDALDYMLKPVTYPMFQLKMQKAVRHIEKNGSGAISVALKGQQLVRIPLTDLLYIEVQGHYLLYHTETSVYEVRGSLRELEEKLISHHFLRCNNCYLVNLRHIRSVEDNVVIVGEDRLPISRPKKKSFLDGLTEYLGL